MPGVAVTDEDFAGGVLSVLRQPVSGRRAAARARAEQFGWPAAVGGFLAAHAAVGVDAAERADQAHQLASTAVRYQTQGS